jgi:hypothetical protein
MKLHAVLGGAVQPQTMLAVYCVVPEVVNGSMGSELAEFLVEFLPFEESSRAIINSVYAILQPGLVDSDTRADVWKRAKRRNAFYLGFIRHGSVDLPEDKAGSSRLLLLSGSTATTLQSSIRTTVYVV